MGKSSNKFDNMKMYRDRKAQGLQRIKLLVEIFANVNRFGF